MVKFLPLIFGFLLVGLFAIAFISGGLRLAEVNEASQSIGDDPAISAYASALNETLENSYDNSVEVEESVGESPVTLTTGFPVFDAIFGIWKTIKVVPLTIYNLTVGLLFEKVLGDESYGIITGVLSAMLIIALVYAVYRVITSGDSG